VYRKNLTGPFAEVTVGAGSSAVVFTLPKELLCDSSTYFKAALNNGFAETATQKITLDDDNSDVFRTYATWLFQREITEDTLRKIDNEIEPHLYHVYMFADRRGIRCLANDVTTMLASFWCTQNLDTDTVIECLPLLQPQCGLSELVLDNLVLDSRDELWDTDDWNNVCRYSPEIIVELFKKDRAFPDSFNGGYKCFNSICHYHKHEDDDEKKECVKKTERGRNIHPHFGGPWKQTGWRW
jgi:hypothetical protein